MGTRGLVGHIVRGRKKASYNHFDSYPSALEVEIVRFIKSLSPEQLDTMIQNLNSIEWVDWSTKPSEELQRRYTADGTVNLGVGSQSPEDWYCLLHKVQGANALPRILDGTLSHLTDNTDFEQDELFCEWVYWIDWEKKILQVNGSSDPAEITFAQLTEEWMLSRKVRSGED